MEENTFEKDPVEEEKPAAERPGTPDSEDQKPKDVSLRSGFSKKDKAPSEPKRFTPEEIEAYLKAQKAKKRPG